MAKKNGRKQRENETAEPPMSSMIDVVFLLLIYFIVTQKEQIPEAHMSVNLPSPSAASKNQEEPPKILEVQVLPGQYIFQGVPRTLKSIKDTLVYLGGLDPDQTVIIKTSISAFNKELISLLDLCKSAGLTKLNLVTLK